MAAHLKLCNYTLEYSNSSRVPDLEQRRHSAPDQKQRSGQTALIVMDGSWTHHLICMLVKVVSAHVPAGTQGLLLACSMGNGIRERSRGGEACLWGDNIVQRLAVAGHPVPWAPVSTGGG